jgi:hypothetical protein
MVREVFTTGQVAKVLQTSVSHVKKTLDSGILKCFKVPSSKHRRIMRLHLIEFMKKYDIPLSMLEEYEGVSSETSDV